VAAAAARLSLGGFGQAAARLRKLEAWALGSGDEGGSGDRSNGESGGDDGSGSEGDGGARDMVVMWRMGRGPLGSTRACLSCSRGHVEERRRRQS